MKKKHIRDYGILIGEMPTGEKNTICDVNGVTVGHHTIHNGEIHTGVTALFPHQENLFEEKVPAAAFVANGFGKSMGLVQIEELGNIETPILLTNTLSIGTAADTLIKYKIARNPTIGNETGTVNPVVCECNDGPLNDIRGQHVTPEMVNRAMAGASSQMEEGAVGGGAGMSCYKLKGGIGSASRIIEAGEKRFTLGVMVQTNMGELRDLTIDGNPVGRKIVALQKQDVDTSPDKGSIIIIVATDAPLSSRQLKRVAKRAMVGVIRTGSYIGEGSGEISLAFSTGRRIHHQRTMEVCQTPILHESRMDLLFRAVAEATEEAILNSMTMAETTTGFAGLTRTSLNEYASFFEANDEDSGK